MRSAEGTTASTAPIPCPEPQISFHAFAPELLPLPKFIAEGSLSGRVSGSSPAAAIDPRISIATVYRTVRLFEEAGILERHDFGKGRSRYEAATETHHDHLIDVETGRVIEFVDPELEQLQKAIAEKLGFRLVDHRMELYGVSVDRKV